MVSLRSAFSRFILSGVICCAIVLGLPTESLAESVNLLNDEYSLPAAFVNKTLSNITASDLSDGNLDMTYTTHYTSGDINWRVYITVSSSISQPCLYFRLNCSSLGINGNTVKVVTPSMIDTANVIGVRYFVKVGNTKTELIANDGNLSIPSNAVSLFVICQASSSLVNTSMSNPAIVFKPMMQVWTSVPDDGMQQVVQNQTDQLTDTTGSDTVTSDVTSQFTQQVQGLQLFQFVENLDETFANTLTTQETDSSVVFPGMSLAGFVIPSANIDPLQLVPSDLVTPIKMIVTFTFCSMFISHIISLLHAIFGIYDYSGNVGNVWVEPDGTEFGEPSVWHMNLSG